MNKFLRSFIEGFCSPMLLILPGRESQVLKNYKERVKRFDPRSYDGFSEDRKAIASDWINVGKDIKNAMDEYAQKNNLK